MPINLLGSGCLASVNVSEVINGNLTTSTYNQILTINCIPFIVQNIIFWLLVFAGTVALILIIVSGIKFILSGGDAKQTEGARKTLTYAILGLVLILFSFAILKLIANTTGLKCITRFGFSNCAGESEKTIPLPPCGKGNPHGSCPDTTRQTCFIKIGRDPECRLKCNSYSNCGRNEACEEKICKKCSETDIYHTPCGKDKWCENGSCVSEPAF